MIRCSGCQSEHRPARYTIGRHAVCLTCRTKFDAAVHNSQQKAARDTELEWTRCLDEGRLGPIGPAGE